MPPDATLRDIAMPIFRRYAERDAAMPLLPR